MRKVFKAAILCINIYSKYGWQWASYLGHKIIEAYSWCIYHIVWDDADRKRLDAMVEDIISEIEG
jgi:hypothetical protein